VSAVYRAIELRFVSRVKNPYIGLEPQSFAALFWPFGLLITVRANVRNVDAIAEWI
jgi:hypothetical protein